MLRNLFGALMLGLGLASLAPAQSLESKGISQKFQDRAADVISVMRIPETLGVMARENAAAAAELEPGPPGWDAALARLNAPERLLPIFAEATGQALMTADQPLIDKALTFYTTHPGKKALSLELSAREAMLDPDVEDQAMRAAGKARAPATHRMRQIEDLRDAMGILDANVAGSMNSLLATQRGFADGIGDPSAINPGEVAGQEDDIRAELDDWGRAVLFLAYSGLTDAEVDQLIAFSKSPEGRALDRLLNDAYDSVYTRLGYDIGLLSASQINGTDL